MAAAVLGSIYLENKLALRNDWRPYNSIKSALTKLVSFVLIIILMSVYLINYSYILLLNSLQKAVREDKLNMYYRFRDHAKATPNRVFLIFEGRSYTFRELELGKLGITFLFHVFNY